MDTAFSLFRIGNRAAQHGRLPAQAGAAYYDMGFNERRIVMEKPEILAPAGSMESLRGAVAAGCDAVYLGGSHFGARAYADNLSEEEMVEAIGFCHLHGVKIYLTVNTLMKEEERRGMLYDFLLPYYRAGLDAVIVQDVGVMDFVRKYYPELDIHASTQMALTMGRGADRLKSRHVTRLVPARELSLEELGQMRQDTSLELEVFVHGALCYCYSGQCLFSSMLGGRSGNRGRCAQPCRMPYRGEGLPAEMGNYLLSPRELCNLKYIGELIEIGVDSFKIEGRMKRPEYVALVTSIYRKYVDLYCSLGRQGFQEQICHQSKEWQQDMRHLAELYNREGFTQGYLEGMAGDAGGRVPGRRGDMLARRRPKHGGVLVGEVLSVGKREVVYRTAEELFPQDVVEFRDAQGRQSYEYTLGEHASPSQNVTARYQRGRTIRQGDKAYRTRHGVLLEDIRQRYLGKEVQEPVQGVFAAEVGQPVTLTVQLGEDAVCCQGEICQRAKNQPVTEEIVKKSLGQTGNSPFYFDNLVLEMGEDLFLSVGMLKKLRRRAFEELAGQRMGRYHRDTEKSYGCDNIKGKMEVCCESDSGKKDASGMKPSRREMAATVMTMSQLDAVLEDDRVARVYVSTEELSPSQLALAWEKISGRGKEPCLAMPRVFRKGVWALWEEAAEMEGGFLTLPWIAYLVRNWESLRFLEEQGIPLQKVVLDYHMYVMNEGSAAFWREEGVGQFTLPLELTGKELAQLSFLESGELVVYGRLPLMVTAQCMLANTEKCLCREDDSRRISFVDQRGRRFFSKNYCRYCYNVIYQEEALMLGRQQWDKLSVCRLRWDFVDENPARVRDIMAGAEPKSRNMGHWTLGID